MRSWRSCRKGKRSWIAGARRLPQSGGAVQVVLGARCVTRKRQHANISRLFIRFAEREWFHGAPAGQRSSSSNSSGLLLTRPKQLGGSGRPSEVKEIIVEKLKVSDGEQGELTASGVLRFGNRIDWARFYLVRAGYLDASVRGVWSLTEKGRQTDSITHEQALAIDKQVRQELKDERVSSDGEMSGDQIDENIAPEPADYRVELLELLKGYAPQRVREAVSASVT